MRTKLFLSVFFLLPAFGAFAQFSISTDVSVLRNWSPQQKFWAVGQTIQGNFYAHEKGGPYALLGYYLKGSFQNSFTALAKQPATTPASLPYSVRSTWQFRQLSLGWKHYFKGAYNSEHTWTLYGTAGFGLLFARIENSYNPGVDTAAYFISNPRQKEGKFNRLTYDFGLGAETPIGSDVYFYGEVRAVLQSSDSRSALLVRNKQVPLATSINGGLRILIQ